MRLSASLCGVLVIWVTGLALVGAAEGAKPVPPNPSLGSGGQPGMFDNQKLTIAGQEREYRVVVPRGLDLKQPMPLVFAFHGLGGSKDFMSFSSQFHKTAEKHKFIVVYPSGRNRMWPLVVKRASDDLAFFDAMYKDVSQKYNIDQNRVYLIGMSNGAYFSHLVASQRSDQVAAIAAHSGGMGLLREDPKLKQKYAVMLIHGDVDSIVKVKESRDAQSSYKKWGHAVEYVEVPGLNHHWAHGVDINEKIWGFFTQHALR